MKRDQLKEELGKLIDEQVTTNRELQEDDVANIEDALDDAVSEIVASADEDEDEEERAEDVE